MAQVPSLLKTPSKKLANSVFLPKKRRFARPEQPIACDQTLTIKQKLLEQSNSTKAEANTHFGQGDFSQAISTYDRALSFCPNYLDYEIAVLRSNIAACHVKLEDWKTAVDSATQGLDALDRAEGKPSKDDASEPDVKLNSNKPTDRLKASKDHDADQVVELDDTQDVHSQLQKLQLSDERKEQIAKLRTKLLLRRAKGNQEQVGWSTLSAAETDYKELAGSNSLPDRDRRFVQTQLRTLPGRINEAKEKEVGEMMGKLKDLGNSFLKPFGLSTDNFNMVKDENTGGYSMNFSGGSGK